MQRFIDVILATLALIALSPVLVPIIIGLKLTGEGEIFYVQNRVGKDLRIFGLLKFATMLKDSEKLGAGTVTIKDDFRVLKFGKLLRKTKVNELPQIINILKGDMSIIGPRPLHSKQFSFYSSADQQIIASVRPGLSGMGSVVFRDEESILQSGSDHNEKYKKEISPIKAELENYYVSNRSMGLYFKLIALTILVVLLPNLNIKSLFKHKFIKF